MGIRIRSLIAGFVCAVLMAVPAVAEPVFPALNGRVIDEAHILSPATRNSLETTLENYERSTTNQVVVVTIPSLGGYSIDEYSNELGRHWKIGQKDKNNGVLLLVAPNDKKVRLEVGYGLEPVLTDALSSQIIHGILIPAFRSGKMEAGIVDGTDAILNVLGGKNLPPAQQPDSSPVPVLIAWLVMLLFLWFFIYSLRHPLIAATMISMNSSRHGSSRLTGNGWSGGSFRGGFSGGGGSFGGGGASGKW